MDRAAGYKSEPILNELSPMGLKVIHTLLVLYKNCKRPRSGRGVSSSVRMIVNNIEGLNLDVSGKSKEQEKDKPNKTECRKND